MTLSPGAIYAASTLAIENLLLVFYGLVCSAYLATLSIHP
jgi:hypothetical protein